MRLTKKTWRAGMLARVKESGSVWEDLPISSGVPPRAGSRMHWVNAGDLVLVLSSKPGDKEHIMRVLHDGKQLIMWDNEVEHVDL